MDVIVNEIEFKENQNNFVLTYPTHPLSDIGKYKIGNGIFIETGTHVGTTVRRALNANYKKIFSIEIQTQLFDMVKNHEIFKEHINNGRLTLYNGSSIDKLNEILEIIDEPATFWLDGHLHMSRSYGKIHDSPIIEELNIIKSHKIKNHTILIDDLRIIRNGSWGRGNLYDEVIKIIYEINPKYNITFGDGLEPKDVLIAMIDE